MLARQKKLPRQLVLCVFLFLSIWKEVELLSFRTSPNSEYILTVLIFVDFFTDFCFFFISETFQIVWKTLQLRQHEVLDTALHTFFLNILAMISFSEGKCCDYLEKLSIFLIVFRHFDANFASQFNHAFSVFLGGLSGLFGIPDRLHFGLVITNSVFCSFVGIVPENSNLCQVSIFREKTLFIYFY